MFFERALSGGWDGWWNGRFWGAPIFGQNPAKQSMFSQKDAKSGRPKCLILVVSSVVQSPTMIRVTLLYGRALSEQALWLLLIL